jgi:hypothetical protein
MSISLGSYRWLHEKKVSRMHESATFKSWQTQQHMADGAFSPEATYSAKMLI